MKLQNVYTRPCKRWRSIIFTYSLPSHFFVIYPFWALYDGYKYLVHKSRGEVRDPNTGNWTTKEKIEQEKLKVKMSNREIPLAVRNHITPRKDDCFYFFEKRNLKIPTDKLVYVESEYNDTSMTP